MKESRLPYWSKAMLRQMEGTSPPENSSGESPAGLPIGHLFTAEVLAELGLARLVQQSTDPGQLALQLAEDDARDAQPYVDEFARGIRRAVRLQLAFAAQLHRRDGRVWKEWVAEKFAAGYECYQRYRLAAELQAGLVSRGLPRLVSEAQSRALVPFRKHAKFWAVLGEVQFKVGFPLGAELRKLVQTALAVKTTAVTKTPRLVLHRALSRLIEVTPKSEEPSVLEALGLLRRAIHLLEKGAA